MTKTELLELINTIPDNAVLGISLNMEDIYEPSDVSITTMEDFSGETRVCIDFSV
jgi:hypothetical protein